MIPTLHPFQADLYDRVRAARGRGARIIVVQSPTGSGKTTWASYTCKQAVAKGSRVLFLVHRRRLVDQISSRLEEFEVNHGIIMRGEVKFGSAGVQVASRDTITSRCFIHEWTGLPPAELVVVDEGHHAADPSSDYRRILDQYPKATILLLTATPVGPDGKGLGPWAHAIECAAPISQLIRDGFMTPLKVFCPDRKMGRGGKAKRGIAGHLVDSWRKYAQNLPTVLFCSRVQHSLDAVQDFKKEGISAAHVDADTADEERDRIFDGLGTGAVKVVSNVGIIKEGVDIPCLGCCQFYMDPSGRVGFLQGCGRIMRPFPGKTHGVLIDHAGAVYRHGFPDEDTPWTLEGNADADFKKKLKDGDAEKPHYCKGCELLYHGPLACPQCGKQPSKPPRSIFAPPPVETTNELLTEAERNQAKEELSMDGRIKSWLACLGAAANIKEGKSFSMAAMMYKRKYGNMPWDDKGLPCMPGRSQWKMPVHLLYPKFRKKRA